MTGRDKFGVYGGAERAAAAKDRATWLQWQPSRGGQMAIAMVDAVVRSPVNYSDSLIAQRVAMTVRTMR